MRLIDEEAVLEFLRDDTRHSPFKAPFKLCTADSVDVKFLLKQFPTIEAEPVRHGRWVDHMCRDWRCSECGKKARFDGYCYDDKPNYCPNCGAKMDLGV